MYERFKQLSGDSFIYGLGTAASKAINFLLIPVYTRVFSPHAYGILDVLIMSTTFIVILANMGLSIALTMFFLQAKNEKERKTVVTSNFLFMILMTLLIIWLVVFFSQDISEILLGGNIYADYLIVAAVIIFFTTILNFCATLYRLSFNPVRYFYITLGNVVLSVILSIYLVVYLGMGLMGALYALLISAIVFSAISLYTTRHNFSFNFSLEKLKEMIKVGLPLAPMGVGIWIFDFSARYFLVHLQDLNQVGLYAVGYRFAGFLGIVVSSFRLANVPHQFSAALDGTAKDFYSKTLTYYLLIMLAMVTAISMFSKEIVLVFTTPDYLEAYKSIIPLAFGFVFMGLYHIVGLGLILTRKTHFMTLGSLAGALAVIILNIYLVPKYGFLGAALANATAYFIGLALIYLWAQKYYPVNYEFKKILKLLLGSLVLIFLGLTINTNFLVLNLFIKTSLIGTFILLGYFTLEKKEVDGIKMVLNSFKKRLFKNKHES